LRTIKLGLRHLFGVLCAAGLIGAAFYHVHSSHGVSVDDVVVFVGLQGPSKTSTVLPEARSEWRSFAREGASRLAVLLTDDNSPWLALAHGLETIGVPFTITDDVRTATKHAVVLVYPIVSGKVLTGEGLRALARHARNGGTLIATNLAGGGLAPIFGIREPRPSRQHTNITLDTSHPLARAFTAPDDRHLPFASTKPGHAPFGTHGYTLDGATAVATFDDGVVALTERRLSGGGRAYALGLDPGFLLQRAYGRRLEGVAAQYANGYSPTVDVVLRLLKGIYQAGQKHAVTLGVVPDAKRLATVFSHDIDYNRSIVNAVAYARHERENGFAGTHFIQTKYIRDWNDSAFLDQDNRKHVEALAALDMEIASHSVSHSRVFSKFKIGTGDEQYPSYQPFVVSATETRNGTVLGELRVSRFVLENLVPGTRVSSFRPGHLEYPSTLPEALDAAGYQNSSSVTANVSLSHLPFRLTYTRKGQAQVDVYEFPITIEDELPPAMLERLDDAMVVARKIGRHGGIYVVLIHPDVTAQKLEFQMQLTHRLKRMSWFGSLAELGAWWRARAALGVEVTDTGGGFVINLQAPKAIAGLPLEIPRGFAITATSAVSVIEQREGVLLIDIPAGPASLTLRKAS
jgi:hypothetical protein